MNLANIVESHSDELYERWLKEVKQHTDTPTYHHYQNIQRLGHVRNIYNHLSEIIENDDRDRIERIYTALGSDRFHQGFSLSEVLKALILAKRVLWSFVESRGFYSAMEMLQAMHFRRSILLFFDRAIFFTAKGYEREASIYRKIFAHT